MEALLDRQLLGPLIVLGGFALVFASYVIGTSGFRLNKVKKK